MSIRYVVKMASCPVPAPAHSSSRGSTARTIAQVLCLLFSILFTLCISTLKSCILGVSNLLRPPVVDFPGYSHIERLDEKSSGDRLTGGSSNDPSVTSNESETQGQQLTEEAAPCAGQEVVALYEGRVWHERRHPVTHKFDYGVRYAFVNLDNPPKWYVSSAANNHMTAQDVRNIAGTRGTVYLLTMPTSVGYEQNPLSVYYCYGENAGQLLKCIAEVTNTPWGERVTFIWDPRMDTVAKPLHVSPFMDMLGSWRMVASAPGPNLQISIQVEHPELGNYFVATLRLRRVDSKSVGSAESFFWLMPHKVAVWIYWQALLLAWKGVAVQSHPKDLDGAAYRNRARARDATLLSSREVVGEKKPRFFQWRDAGRWPWN